LSPLFISGGNKALFKGGFTTVLRAVAMNASMTGPYDWLREKMWITFGDFGFIDVIPIFYAAAWGTAITLPIDNIKTKLQRAFPDPLKNR
jgi:solute carrier family 25 oxoglutarate transporter 11